MLSGHFWVSFLTSAPRLHLRVPWSSFLPSSSQAIFHYPHSFISIKTLTTNKSSASVYANANLPFPLDGLSDLLKLHRSEIYIQDLPTNFLFQHYSCPLKMVALLTGLIQLRTLDIILMICLVSPLTIPSIIESSSILCPIKPPESFLLHLSILLPTSPGLGDHYLSPGLWRCPYTLVSWHLLALHSILSPNAAQ